MRIQTKTAATLLLLSLVPMAIVGGLAYTMAGRITRNSLAASFSTAAQVLGEQIERSVYDAYQNVLVWADLDVMQQVISGDADGRLTSFVLPLGRQFDDFAAITVLNRSGEVVAGNNLSMVGYSYAGSDCAAALTGKPHAGEPQLDSATGRWVLPMSAPIRAAYDEGDTIGVLCALWRLDQLGGIVQPSEDSQDRKKVMIVRRDGLVIASPLREQVFSRNLKTEGTAAVIRVLRGERGTRIDHVDAGGQALVAYEPLKPYRLLPNLGWGVLVWQDTSEAFASLRRLRLFMLGLGTFIGCSVIALSFVLSRQLTGPIFTIAQAASRLAQGEFEPAEVPHTRDELESLAVAFNQMVEDLRQQRTQLVQKEYVDNILASMNDALMVVDPSGRIKLVNRAACELLGYAEAELVSQPVARLFPEDGVISRPAPASLAGTGPTRQMMETAYRAKGGRRIPILFSSATLYGTDGAIQGIVCVAQDISRIKQAEEASSRLAAIVESSHDAILSQTLTGEIVSWNAGAERLYGYAASEMVGRNLSAIVPPERYVELDGFRARASNGERVGPVETIGLRKDGQRIPVSLTVSPMRDGSGRVMAACTIVRDITQQKQAEEKLMQLNTDLGKSQQELISTVEDLRRSHQELKDAQLQLIQAVKLESVGRLAAGVAHEVKNPLAIILMGLEYLKKIAVDDSNTESVVNEMTQAVNRADSVVRGMLDFASSNRVDLSQVSLHTVMDQALLLVKHEFVRSHVKVDREYAADLPDFPLDRGKMEQVFVNLFLNAAHAMPDSGKLSIRTSLRVLSEAGPGIGKRSSDFFHLGEKVVAVEVDDSGTGIPEEKLSKIFDPFFTTKPTGKGTGLGLTVVRKIIELHRGSIDIHNRPDGKGVRVTLLFKIPENTA